MVRSVDVGGISVGPGHPLAILAGPCVLEDPEMALQVAEGLARACAGHGLPYVFKGSFDKANRTRAESFRGPGLHDGLAWLQRVREQVGVAVTTDVHEPAQAAP